jgi:hypothetical protein
VRRPWPLFPFPAAVGCALELGSSSLVVLTRQLSCRAGRRADPTAGDGARRACSRWHWCEALDGAPQCGVTCGRLRQGGLTRHGCVAEEFERLQSVTASLDPDKRAGSPLISRRPPNPSMLDSITRKAPSNPDEAQHLRDRSSRKVPARPVSSLFSLPTPHIPLPPSLRLFLYLPRSRAVAVSVSESVSNSLFDSVSVSVSFSVPSLCLSLSLREGRTLPSHKPLAL